jgi:RNA polymerase sigma factor (sigma-70 family)
MVINYLNRELLNLEKGISRYIHTLNIGTEEKDLVQKTLIDVIKRNPRFRKEDYLKLCMERIEHKTFLNNFRRIVKQDTKSYFNDELFLIYRTDEDSEEEFKKIISNIEQLDEKLIKPFLLFVDGYTYDEIADAINLKVETVKTRILIARGQLILK